MTPEEEQELAELEELERLEAEIGGSAQPARDAQPPGPDAAKAAELAPLLKPTMPIAPQVLATQPATTHPGGDEAAQADWVVKGTDSAKGATVVYEPPLSKARKELLENPQLLAALYPDEPITPEEIQAMDESSDIYKTYADHKWNEVRWAAADSGTTAYRHSKMPWLQGGAAGLSPLNTLVTKLRASALPVLEGTQAFILGQDDTAHLGATRRATEAMDGGEEARPPKPQDGREYNWHPTLGWTAKELGTDPNAFVGGATVEGGGDVAKTNEMVTEENPKLHTAGQVAGLFSPDSVMGLLGKAGSALTEGAGALAARLGGGTVAKGAAKLGAAGAAAAGGGAAVSAGRDVVDATANVAKTGEAGTTLGEAAGRATEAALDPMNLGLGVGGEAAGMAFRAGAKAIANSPRYGGNIERVKQLGGKFGFGKGPMGTKETERVTEAAKARDITPTAVLAEELAPKIAEAENALAAGNFEGAKAAKEAVKIDHARFKEQYFKSKEGSQVLPPVATMEANLKHLRTKMTAEPGGGLRPVGNADGVATARAEFSGDVAKVSLEPAPGAIELSPDEAEMFLSPSLTHDLVPKPKKPPTPPPAAPAPGANKQGVNVIKPQASVPVGEAPTVPPKGKAAKPAGKVEALPDTEIKPTLKIDESFGQARNEYGEKMRPHREAQRADNKRAEALGEEFGPPEARDWKGHPTGPAKTREQVQQDLDKVWTPEERQVAQGKSHARFYEVNEVLRGQGKMTPEVKTEYEKLDGIFKKAIDSKTTFSGKTVRGIGVTAEQAKQLESGKVLTTRGFMSSSTDPRVADQFKSFGASSEHDVPVMFEIQGRTGVPIGSGQSEIVHRPGTQFKVVGKRMDGETPVYQLEESGYSVGGRSDGILASGGMLAIGGAAAAAGEDDGTTAGASAVGLALALKKRGVSKVYVVPRRYDAQQHEVRIGQLKDLTKDPKMPGAREAKERYAAALQDRGQRSLDGKPGGWSAKQQEVSEKLTALEQKLALAEKEATRKASAKREAPGGTANSRLVRYSKQRDNELPLKKEIEDAGARAGVLPQLQNLRLLDPLEQLRGSMSYRGKTAPRSKSGLVGAMADQAALRFLYPGLDAAGSSKTLQGGMSGVRVQQLVDDEKKKEAR